MRCLNQPPDRVSVPTVSEGSRVAGQKGHNVTLTCRYDVGANGERAICWNRGAVPSTGCNNQLAATQWYKGNKESSSKYQLLGRLEEGDASLTILNLTEEDAGGYGCRVDIAGVFNDEKHHFDLTIEGGEKPEAFILK